jgi:hypothetical protein
MVKAKYLAVIADVLARSTIRVRNQRSSVAEIAIILSQFSKTLFLKTPRLTLEAVLKVDRGYRMVWLGDVRRL